MASPAITFGLRQRAPVGHDFWQGGNDDLVAALFQRLVDDREPGRAAPPSKAIDLLLSRADGFAPHHISSVPALTNVYTFV
jgi:hypothetical protein